MAKNKTLQSRILKNGCYYEYEGSKMVVAIKPYIHDRGQYKKSNNYEAERILKKL